MVKATRALGWYPASTQEAGVNRVALAEPQDKETACGDAFG